MEFRFALQQAKNAGLDLVEMGQRDGMPVCKIMDFGKMKYDTQKSKKPQTKIVVKEIKMSPRIDQHDIDVKIKQVQKWIGEGHKVYVAVQFRGRENTHKELGMPILTPFRQLVGASVTEPKLDGNMLSVYITKTAN